MTLMALDPRNRLNDISNRTWLRLSKSVWKSSWIIPESQHALHAVIDRRSTIFPSVLYSMPRKPDRLKRLHPATFAESDIRRILLLFTKKGNRVLDPFCGVGSTLLASAMTGRSCVGIDLSRMWTKIARERLENWLRDKKKDKHSLKVVRPLSVLTGDACATLRHFSPDTFDFIVTSPPYWNILWHDHDHKVRATRLENHLPTKYSANRKDLGNIENYDEFLYALGDVFAECFRVLRSRKYACVIVSDFRRGEKFYDFHGDMTNLLRKCGFSIEGITILVQDRKKLYPYGIPHAYVSNIHHAYVLICRKRN
jgi:DNA modification methylase